MHASHDKKGSPACSAEPPPASLRVWGRATSCTARGHVERMLCVCVWPVADLGGDVIGVTIASSCVFRLGLYCVPMGATFMSQRTTAIIVGR